jgi:hypothetical protein
MSEVGDALSRFDPPSPAVLDDARAARDYLPSDGSCFCELVYDSVLDSTLGDAPPLLRSLVFASSGLRVVLRIDRRAAPARITGWTFPVLVESVQLTTARVASEVSIQSDGSFAFEADRVPSRLELVVEGSLGTRTSYTSSWFTP